MRTENILSFVATGFKGIAGRSVQDSITEHEFIYKEDGDFTHFVFSPDHPSTGYSTGILDSNATREDEFFWVTEEQWHKIARANECSIELVMNLKLPTLTFFVYDYFGAEPIFGKPRNKFMIRMEEK